MASAVSKICTKCLIEKPLSDYHLKKGGNLGRRSDCKCCVANYQSDRRNGPKREQILAEKRKFSLEHPELKRAHNYRTKYNLTLEDYNSKLNSQNGCCAICGATNPNNNQHKHLYVDHNHGTGKVRGLLCNPCNTTIGASQEDIERLIRCAEYLKIHNG